MTGSRSNFDDFDNRDIWEAGKKALERRKKRRKRIRNFSVAIILSSTLLIIVVVLRPDYFSFFSLSKISRYLSILYPEQQMLLPSDTKKTQSSTSKAGPTIYPEYNFTKEEIDKVTREMLEKHQGDGSKVAYIKKLIKKNEDGNFLYDIELTSGERFYSDSAKLDNNIIAFEDKKGLVIEFGTNQIAQIKLLIKKGGERE